MWISHAERAVPFESITIPRKLKNKNRNKINSIQHRTKEREREKASDLRMTTAAASSQKEIKFEMKTNLRSGLQCVHMWIEWNETHKIQLCFVFFAFFSSLFSVLSSSLPLSLSISLCPQFGISVTLDWQTQQHILLDCGYKMLLLQRLLLPVRYMWECDFLNLCVCVHVFCRSQWAICAFPWINLFITLVQRITTVNFHWIFCVVSLANESARNRKRNV